MKRRILSVLLSIALLLPSFSSVSISALAAVHNEVVAEKAVEADDDNDNESSASEKEETKVQEKTTVSGNDVIEDEDDALELDEIEESDFEPSDYDSADPFYFQQHFEEKGFTVTIKADQEVVPDGAIVSMDLLGGKDEKKLEKLVTKEQEELIADGGEDAAIDGSCIYNMYADLSVEDVEVYAVDINILYLDEDENVCVFEPEKNESIAVSFEIDDKNISEMNLGDIASESSDYDAQKTEKNSEVDDLSVVETCYVDDEIKEIENLSENTSIDGEELSIEAEHFSIYAVNIVTLNASADPDTIDALDTAWGLLDDFGDPDKFLVDPYYKTALDKSKEEYQEMKNAAEYAISSSGATTSFDKISALNEYVACNTYYDYNLSEKRVTRTLEHDSPYYTFKNTQAVCSGYARLLRTMLISQGIPCFNMVADNHEYCAAYDGTKWVFADPTWASGNTLDKTVGEGRIAGSYRSQFFNTSIDDIALYNNHEVAEIPYLLKNDGYYYFNMAVDNENNVFDYSNWNQDSTWKLYIYGAKDGASDVTYVSQLNGIDVTEVANENISQYISFPESVFPGSYGEAEAYARYCAVKSITLPNSIVQIKDAAFSDLKTLEKINFPSSLTNLGEGSFYNCSALKKVDLSATSVTTVPNWAFGYCGSMTDLKLPAGVTAVDDYAFFRDDSLTQIFLPMSTLTVGADAFSATYPIDTYVFTSMSLSTSANWAKRNVIFESASTKPVVSASTKGNGIKLVWSDVSGMTSYQLYKSVDGGAYTQIYSGSNLSYTDTAGIQTGKKYAYKVKALDGSGGETAFSDVRIAYYIPATTVTLEWANETVLPIKWTPIEGATQYYIQYYKRNGSNELTRYETTIGNESTEFDATNAAFVEGYLDCAIVQAIITNEDGTFYGEKGYGEYYYVPEIGFTTTSKTASGVSLAWESASGVDGYVLEKSVNGSDFTEIQRSKQTTYLDTEAKDKIGQYNYRVRAYRRYNNKDYFGRTRQFHNTYRADLSDLPDMNESITTTPSGFSISWSAVAGADGYSIYKKVGSDRYFTPVGDVSTTTFNDTLAVESGTIYMYQIRPYYMVGESKHPIEGPVVVSGIQATDIWYFDVMSGNLTMFWHAVSGCSGYEVRKSVDGGAEKLAYSLNSSMQKITPDAYSSSIVYRVYVTVSDGVNTYYSPASEPVTLFKPRYHLDGGTNNGSNPTEVNSFKGGGLLYAPNRFGFLFDGWYSDPEYTNAVTEIPVGTVYTDLYAKWTTQEAELIENTEMNIDSVSRNTDGAVLKWKTVEALTGASFSNSISYNVYRSIDGGADTLLTTTLSDSYTDTEIDLDAHTYRYYVIATATVDDVDVSSKFYTAVSIYPIVYVLNGGQNNAGNPRYCDSTTAVSLKAPTRKNYTFAGWYSNAGLTNRVTNIKVGTPVVKTLYAKWNPIPVKVKLDANGGKGTTSITGTLGGKYTRLTTPTMANFTFLGWYTAKEGGTKVTSATTISNSKAHTLYAHWKANYPIKKATVKVKATKKLSAPGVNKKNAKKVKWKSSKSSIVSVSNSSGKGKIKGKKAGVATITAYLSGKPIIQYTVTVKKK